MYTEMNGCFFFENVIFVFVQHKILIKIIPKSKFIMIHWVAKLNLEI